MAASFGRLPLVAAGLALAGLVVWGTPERGAASREAPTVADRAEVPARPLRGGGGAAAPERREAPVVAAAAWGSGPGALGHEIPTEGAPMGPMSFAADAAGRIHALDTMNGRIVVLDPGKPPGAVPLPSLTVDDLDLTDDGGYVVVDRHQGKAVHLLTAEGQERGRVALSGAEIEQPGAITAVFWRRDGAWVEIEHRRLVRVSDPQGLPVERRSVVPGRFTADGQGVLRAERRGSKAAVAVRSASGDARVLAEPSFALPVATLTALEATASGGVVLGAELHRDRAEAPFDTLEVRRELVGLDASGAERWRAEIPPDEGPEENLRPVRLGRDGAVYAMVFRREGVEFRKVTP